MWALASVDQIPNKPSDGVKRGRPGGGSVARKGKPFLGCDILIFWVSLEGGFGGDEHLNW